MLVSPSYLRVFNIKDGLAAVRLQDARLAVVDVSGPIVRNLGKGLSARIESRDFVAVERNNDQKYIDLLNGQTYYDRPTLDAKGELQLVRTVCDGWLLRLKDSFLYGRINDESCDEPIKEYGYFYRICLSKCNGNVDGYAVDTRTLIVLKGDNERAYWLYDVHEDGGLDVIDRQGNCYRVLPDGTRERLSRCAILERSRSVLKEIANQYKAAGGDPEDDYEKMWFRNRVLHHRLADKLTGDRGEGETIGGSLNVPMSWLSSGTPSSPP